MRHLACGRESPALWTSAERKRFDLRHAAAPRKKDQAQRSGGTANAVNTLDQLPPTV
ncbi:hypothetical protein ABE205_22395 [Brevibacillus agri]|uniref:hypothetical protein n=1 Tax=Brevibacillus agri TaxID=51101 RepID=UPI0018CC8B23|nr:hypothetical protein [Brevibacillus agri]MBY0054322.1 hypothetical protein [Brevibacillus agri]